MGRISREDAHDIYDIFVLFVKIYGKKSADPLKKAYYTELFSLI